MDRRALFFLGSAAVCLVLTPVAPPDLRWFALVLAGAYVVLATASALDTWFRHRHRPPH
jgi:hypothetical protein